MNSMKKKANIYLVLSSIFFLFVIFFVDRDSLNSLFINYGDHLIIEEVALATNNSNSQSDVGKVTFVNSPTDVASLDYWAWPTDPNYTITQYYSSYHRALDIYSFNGNGSYIYASNNGVVTSVKGGCVAGNLSCNGRGGNYIVINHNNGNYYTVYMHLKDISVSVGQVVSRGQVIGTMGNTGNVSPVPSAMNPYLGTHLHFCVYIGEPFTSGYAINPMGLY